MQETQQPQENYLQIYETLAKEFSISLEKVMEYEQKMLNGVRWKRQEDFPNTPQKKIVAMRGWLKMMGLDSSTENSATTEKTQ